MSEFRAPRDETLANAGELVVDCGVQAYPSPRPNG